MGRMFLIAARSLLQHRRRTFLLGAAISGVSALLVLLLGLTNGVQDTMISSATTLMTGHVNVGGFYKVTAGQSAPVVTDYRKVRELVQANVPELDFMVDRGRGWAKLISDTGSTWAGIGGIDIEAEPAFRRAVQIAPGNGDIDALTKPNTIMLFQSQAKELEVKVGDTITVSAPNFRGTNNTLDVTVVAIANDIGLLSSFNTYMPNGGLRQLYTMNDETTGVLYLYLKDMGQVREVQKRLRDVLKANGYEVMDDSSKPFWEKFQNVNREAWTGQRLDVTIWEDEISFVKWVVSALTALSLFLTVILLIIVSVGILNIMWITIRERTREIGTLRAIGMQRLRVLTMFLIEGFLLGAVSTIAGGLLALLVALIVKVAHVPIPWVGVQLFLMTDRLVISPTVAGVLFAITFITFCMTVVTLIPSFLAARMKPITAMHHIG